MGYFAFQFKKISVAELCILLACFMCVVQCTYFAVADSNIALIYSDQFKLQPRESATAEKVAIQRSVLVGEPSVDGWT